eukprot:COSAG04_NODE_431_length_14522_cov_23.420717_8_plen_364_part_00
MQFLKIEGALSAEELRSARAAATRYMDTAMREAAALPEGFWQEEHDPRQFHSGFAFERALERLATHPAIWPVVLELTGGRPHLVSGNLCVDRADIYTAGITLHCGREDDNPADPADLPHLEATAEGELRCNNFVFFPCEPPPSPPTPNRHPLPFPRLTEVLYAQIWTTASPATVGSSCSQALVRALPSPTHFRRSSNGSAADKAAFARPRQMFGLFSTEAREQNDGQVSAPRSNSHTEAQWPVPSHPGSAGIPDLPAGMLSVNAKAGDFLMIPCASPDQLCFLPSPDLTWPVREALVHAAMPWIPTDRQRRMLLLRFKPQHPDNACFPPEIVRRLAPETRAVAELWSEGEVRAVATQPGSARL